MKRDFRALWELCLLVAALAGFVAGGLLAAAQRPELARVLWGAITALVLLSTIIWSFRGLLRKEIGAPPSRA